MSEDNQVKGKRSFSKKFDPVRAAALEALVMIEQGDQADRAIAQVTQDADFRSLDQRFLLQLVHGTTKMRRRLDHEIKFYLARPSVDLPLKISNILRLGFYQLHFTDRIPDAAAVSESVNLALHMTDRPRANLVNAVMRTCLREPERVRFISHEENPARYLADFYSFPEPYATHCLREFGFEKTEAMFKRDNESPQVTYRVNFLKAKPDEVANILQRNDVDFSYGRFLPEFIHIEQGGLPLQAELVETGKVYIQDESSGLAVRLLNPRPKNDVLDLAAAPGGKSTYIAIRMRNRGRLTSVDKSHQRLEMLVQNATRLGISIIAPVVSDVMDFTGGPYDRVLLDPPCSGWGTAGKNSDLRWAKDDEDIQNLAKIQKVMIDRAAKMVKPGGVLVYSTCTIIREENDQIVEEFLLRNRNFEIDSASEYFGDELVSERGFVKTYPVVGNLEGAFCARLKRKLH